METNIIYSVGNSSRRFHIRELIAEFALKMELEMEEKDKQKYNHEDKSIDSLLEKLVEERREVDDEFDRDNIDEQLLRKELIHEAIMTMLLWSRKYDNYNIKPSFKAFHPSRG